MKYLLRLTTLFLIIGITVTCEKENQPPITQDTYTDSRDGNTYKIVKIGEQYWMAENLAYLPSVSPSSAESYPEPYYYVNGYKGTSVSAAKAADNYVTYGVLYNWPAALTACPSGWHLPSDAEWIELKNALTGVDKGSQLAGNTSLWNNGALKNSSQFGISGFSCVPGGFRNFGGGFYFVGSGGNWWSATEYNSGGARDMNIGCDNTSINSGFSAKDFGFSVRCLRD